MPIPTTTIAIFTLLLLISPSQPFHPPQAKPRSPLASASRLLSSPPSPLIYPILCVDHGLLRSGIAFTSRGIGFDDVGIIRHNSTAEYSNIDDEAASPRTQDEDDLHAIIADALAEIETDNSTPTPTTPQPAPPTSPLTAQIVKYAWLLSVKTIVVGLPLFKDGTESKQSRIVRQYCDLDLKKSLVREFGGTYNPTSFTPNIKLTLFDERYSSSEAAALISSSSGNSRPVTADLDAVSACVILSHYCKVDGAGAEELAFTSSDDVPSLLTQFEVNQAERIALTERQRNMSTLKESRKEMISRLERTPPNPASSKKKKKKKKKR
ncbi:hypothetical protein TrLO_g126 [Triparma laevis f. longispina]|uniref:YqgF/RNase H-like domain-containing protein n=1 Tax=Triparma laevis f. longispina TaxID=1714387 RepID=A0A9W7C7B7_9STRA|nr:hypothetical protein TrLO_g126 [Triparma laevis f. longispina]